MGIGFRLAWRNLWRHPRRTWLTVAAMVFCNILLIFLISIQLGSYQLMIENGLRVFSGHLQIQHQKFLDEPRIYYSFPDSNSLIEEIQAIPEVNGIAARAEGFALASSAQRSFGIQVMGVQPKREPSVSNIPGMIVEGDYLSDENAEQIVLGIVLARNLKVELGDEITLFGNGRDGSTAAVILTLTGIFETHITELDRSIAQIPLQTFQSVFSMEGEVHRIVIQARSLEQVQLVENKIKKQIKNQMKNQPDIQVLDWTTLQPELEQTIQTDMVSSWFTYGVLIILVAFSVLNTQLMSVLERTKEYGIVMALGLTPWRLGRLILLETGLMAGLGTVIGMLLGGALVVWLSQVGFTYPGMEDMSAKFNLPDRFYPPLTFISASLGPFFIFTVSVIASIYPALRLRLLKPVEAMRAV